MFIKSVSKILAAALVPTLVSCGKMEVDTLDINRIDDLERRMDEVEKKISIMEIALSQNNLQAQILELQLELTSDIERQEQLVIQLAELQQSIFELITDLAELKNQATVSSIIDPCGDHPTKLDSILIVLSSGDILAYVEKSGKRVFTKLPPGSYQTTDGTGCNFSILNNGAYSE